MFITVKKSTLLAVLFIFVTVVTAGVVYAKRADPVFEDGFTVVLDAGHGGMDGGAVGISGTLEKELNLKVAKRLKKMLKEGGATVKMTREKDESIHDSSAGTVREQKRSDLSKRRDLAMSPDTDMFISIHMNKFEQSQYRGAQIFYADNDKSRDLADKIRERIIPVSEKSDIREIKPAYSTMFILNGTENPAVIVECGFLSNPDEEQLLKDKEYQEKIAKSIYDGICDYIAGDKDEE